MTIPQNPYEAEARERWGRTDAWEQSRERVGKMSNQDWKGVRDENEAVTRDIAALAAKGAAPSSPDVQKLIARHNAWLKNFYDPTPEMYRGLGGMYVDDPRFAANYEKYRPGMAFYMRDAIHAYCDSL